MTGSGHEEPLRQVAFEVWLEEELGAAEAPDLVGAVQRELAGTGEAGAAAGGPGSGSSGAAGRGAWLGAALLLLGLAAVGATLWSTRPTGTREAAADRAQDPQLVEPADLDEFRWFLERGERLRIRSYTSGRVDLDRSGAGQPYEVRLSRQERAWLRGAAANARRAAEPAAHAWHHHIDLIAGDGRFVRVALFPNPVLAQVVGFDDVVLAAGQDCPLFVHLIDAQRQARYAQARLEISDLHQFAPWAPADDWDGRLAVWDAGPDFVENLDRYDWADRLRALDLVGSGPTLMRVTPKLPIVPSLRELRWPGACDASSLRRLMVQPNLRILQPGNPGVMILSAPTNSETRALAAVLLDVVALDRFEELDLSLAGWEDEWFREIEPAARNAPSTRLDLHLTGTRLGERFLKAVAARGRYVTGLRAERSAVNDAALRALRGTAEAGALRHVDLSRCIGITPAGLGWLLERARLRVLRLVETPGDLPTWRRMAATQTGLVRLDLGWLPGGSGGRIDDELVRALAELPQLEFLSLRGRPGWSDAGLAALAEAPVLRELDVRRCPGITAKGLAELRDSRPGLRILSDEDR